MNKKAKTLPKDVILESLMLDPTSKTSLRWKRRPRHHFNAERDWKTWNTQNAGTVAGCEKHVGKGKKYCYVRINAITYLSHRLVYFLAHGVDPSKFQVDHISGDTLNNNPANLRLATNAENSRNRGANRNSQLGIKGVIFHEKTGKYRATICISKRNRFLGSFTEKKDAVAAYACAAVELHKEFARTV